MHPYIRVRERRGPEREDGCKRHVRVCARRCAGLHTLVPYRPVNQDAAGRGGRGRATSLQGGSPSHMAAHSVLELNC